jgi:hypothetical protein
MERGIGISYQNSGVLRACSRTKPASLVSASFESAACRKTTRVPRLPPVTAANGDDVDAEGDRTSVCCSNAVVTIVGLATHPRGCRNVSNAERLSSPAAFAPMERILEGDSWDGRRIRHPRRQNDGVVVWCSPVVALQRRDKSTWLDILASTMVKAGAGLRPTRNACWTGPPTRTNARFTQKTRVKQSDR